jgi:hypothetical protein
MGHLAIQCRARSRRTGDQCKRFVNPGFTVCKWHGAGAPQTIAAAKRRLIEAAAPVADRLVATALEEPRPGSPPCPFCRRAMLPDPHVVLRAQIAVLDRAGLGPKAPDINLSEPSPQWARFLTDEEMGLITTIIGAAKMRALACASEQPVIDVEATEEET